MILVVTNLEKNAKLRYKAYSENTLE